MTAIIFDFNGTMFFDEKFQEISWKEFMEKKINRAITDEEFQTYIHGRNASETFEYFLGYPLSKEDIEQIAEEKEVVYRKLCLASKDFHLAPGLEELLDKLKEFKMPMTIATASGWKNVQFFFQYLHLDRWFDIHQVIYNDGKVAGKPAPDLFLNAAKVLERDIHDCIIFEDSVSGIEAAKRAQAKRIVGVASMSGQERLKNSGATDIICDYTDQKEVLKIIKE